MLNISAKCNIINYKTARNINNIIYNIYNFKLLIIIKKEFGFAKIAQIKIKIALKIKYINTFFLIKNAFKILLN